MMRRQARQARPSIKEAAVLHYGAATSSASISSASTSGAATSYTATSGAANRIDRHDVKPPLARPVDDDQTSFITPGAGPANPRFRFSFDTGRCFSNNLGGYRPGAAGCAAATGTANVPIKIRGNAGGCRESPDLEHALNSARCEPENAATFTSPMSGGVATKDSHL